MEANHHLLANNDPVLDTWILQVHREPSVLQAAQELTVVQQTCHHSPIDCIVTLYEQAIYTLTIHRNIRYIHFGRYLHQPVHNHSCDPNNIMILSVIHLSLDKCIRDVNNSDISAFACIDNLCQ